MREKKGDTPADEYMQFREELKGLSAADFDGHTCFQDLTPLQRLDWLAGAVQFVHLARRSRKPSHN